MDADLPGAQPTEALRGHGEGMNPLSAASEGTRIETFDQMTPNCVADRGDMLSESRFHSLDRPSVTVRVARAVSVTETGS